MLILIGIVPGYFALDRSKSPVNMHSNIVKVDNAIRSIDTTKITLTQYQAMKVIHGKADTIERTVSNITSFDQIPREKHFLLRKNILMLAKDIDMLLKSLSESNSKGLMQNDLVLLKKNVAGLRTNTEYAPWWVILMVSLSLGMGTMIGWKRIVVTVGERIGKTSLNYAQGATSQIVAACTIGASSMFGLPVSTTHVLNSGIAGSMVAQKGLSNLQGKTIKNIALSWVVTLPVTTVLSGSIFLFLRWLL
jgi:PiT family inorganic phosphate transporter